VADIAQPRGFRHELGKGVVTQRSISSWGRTAVGKLRTPDDI
jgi:hypothetical protein